MKYIDKKGKVIKDGQLIVFRLPDQVQPKGYYMVASNVKLCFWSKNENRYVPFSDNYSQKLIKDAEIVDNSVNIK